MRLANDLRKYVSDVAILAELSATLAEQNLTPVVNWLRLKKRSDGLLKRLDRTIQKRKDEKESPIRTRVD